MSLLGSEEIAGLGYEQVIRNAPVAIVVIDASGRVLRTNVRARELTSRQLGVDMPADVDGAIDIFHPDGSRYERHEWPAVRSIESGEEILDEEFFYALPDGARLLIRCSCSPVRDEGGEIVAAVVTMTDVSDQKHVEDQLRSHASLLENIDAAVVGTDSEYLVTAWNAGAERLYGFTAEEVLGRPAREVATHPGDESRTALERELSETGRSRFELTARRKDGTLVEVELVVVALFGERREITGYLGIHRDITERKRAEEANGRSEAILLAEVREAERSRIARDLHDEALQGLAHAVAVTGRYGSSRDDEVHAIVQQVGRQLRAAIYDLRLEQGGERPFADALRDLVELNRDLVPSCEVTLATDDDLARESFGRRGTEVLRIIGEALTNACRHAAAEHIVVRVTGPVTRLSVEVTDDGRGFDVDRRPSALHGGLRGMRERAERLGADLDVRSDPTGTTVRLLVTLDKGG